MAFDCDCSTEIDVNYFAHAIRYLDRPYFMAGLAVPDWLSVVDRRVRVRSRHVEQHRSHFAGAQADIAAGIQQHLNDDQWFHATPAFYDVTGQISALFRKQFQEQQLELGNSTAESDEWPFGFLGHLLTELLIDASLAARYPKLLHAYYERMAEVDAERVAAVVEQLTTKPVTNLPHFIELYRKERFLFDYTSSETLLRRINQVLRRLSQPTLPAATTMTLEPSRTLVDRELPSLLPPSCFGEWP